MPQQSMLCCLALVELLLRDNAHEKMFCDDSVLFKFRSAVIWASRVILSDAGISLQSTTARLQISHTHTIHH